MVRIRYFIDDFGRLWSGPRGVDKLGRYQVFAGWSSAAKPRPIWIQERATPDPAWCEIDPARAARILREYRLSQVSR